MAKTNRPRGMRLCARVGAFAAKLLAALCVVSAMSSDALRAEDDVTVAIAAVPEVSVEDAVAEAAASVQVFEFPGGFSISLVEAIGRTLRIHIATPPELYWQTGQTKVNFLTSACANPLVVKALRLGADLDLSFDITGERVSVIYFGTKQACSFMAPELAFALRDADTAQLIARVGHVQALAEMAPSIVTLLASDQATSIRSSTAEGRMQISFVTSAADGEAIIAFTRDLATSVCRERTVRTLIRAGAEMEIIVAGDAPQRASATLNENSCTSLE